MIIDKNKTYIHKCQIEPEWYIIDAKNQKLGRLSSQIAYKLRGKNNKTYTPHINNRIYIIIINSKLIQITGNKRKQKEYKRHSGKPGGLKIETFEKLQTRMPNKIIEQAIKGMLPKNILGRKLFTQLKIYSDHIHPHSSQQPKLLKLN
uniref:Large ribosomal subunit protein uL13c n=1 Tax=Dipterocladia arabiensis TaxID=2007176 RepID=A0A1Z1M106_9FLOR|nr:ribosomal protein L13 [Dipterocladia arabiensis]ARW59443.1 ribosomal protein L13 [Dipterocladia arabiensis]